MINHNRQVLTSAKWAGGAEKRRAIKRAKKQMESDRINNDVALWCGGNQRSLFPQLPLYVPDANQSAVVIGRPKSGKTFSAINPMLKSAIEQEMAIVLYDYKADDQGNGGQMAYIATLAARHGYKGNVFAPGRDYTCVINPLDFLEDENDDTTAAVLAEVFHKNLKGDKSRGDEFFGPAGQRLIQALLQFAKATPYPDLAMAFSLVRLPQLPERLIYADQQGRLPLAVRIAFSQIMQTAGAAKTTSGITATASDVLTRFMSQRILPSLLGETNISIELGRKELIVFQSDIFRQDVVNPLLAALINVVINRNFSIQRQVPLVFSADEFPTIYLPQCPTWPNEHRSKGFVGLFGFQSFPQIRDAYGREKTDVLLSGVGTHFWFNPGNRDTAKSYSDFIGETEITMQNKSWSRQRGGSGGRNRTISEQTRTRPLILPDEFTRFGTGECVFINPAYGNQHQANLPQHIDQITISQAEIALEQDCEDLWARKVRRSLVQREQRRRPPLDIEEQLQRRIDEAERLLPLPPDEEDWSLD
ncbi:type IV secretory system conjugative DNA transfer family protein [Leptolyngbya sp. PCC 6406]|uniref:type IV secretory system conjugative DNA transfer family protein n=1 Tax=Leptolyngbya sp. PCC 6406 TaxID=1173264 RepID=UPI0002ACC28C|nr:TraM recognition domain-containing protein [Leptolyngbya sp. PCC 6406]